MRERVRGFASDYGKLTLVSLLGVVIAGSLYSLSSHLYEPTLRVSFLDVGQGDAILIQTPSGHTMLVDGGPSRAVLTQLSRQMGYFDRDIDVVVATHPDADHITGLVPVLEAYDVKHVVVSGATSSTGVFGDLDAHINHEDAYVHVARTGDAIDFGDGVRVIILHPYNGERFKDTNDASVSMVITYGDDTFLLTGDLPISNEKYLISHGLLPKHITVYKAGHHGSKTSTGSQLLSYIKPEYAVISAGKDNKYGHPNPETLERLVKYGKETLSTIERGTISFMTDGKSIEVETQK